MVVADALSRAVEIIDSTHSTANNVDSWYTKLKEGIEKCPKKFPQFQLKNDLIYKYCSKSVKNMGYTYLWRLVVPIGDRQNILEECHNDPLSGHGGQFKTVDRIKRKYYWPNMEYEIRQFVKCCDTCKAIKPSNKNQTALMGNHRVVSRPWESVYIDFIGPLPRSKAGFNFILMIVDGFSKFIHMNPLRSATSSATIKCLEDHIFLLFGVPRYLTSDNGPQFISKEFKKFLESYKVNHWLTSRYHPQANASEAANKIAETSIRAYLKDKENHRDWDRNLSKIASSMNTARHTGIHYSLRFYKLWPAYVHFRW